MSKKNGNLNKVSLSKSLEINLLIDLMSTLNCLGISVHKDEDSKNDYLQRWLY